jgi:hypothetical protein
MSWISAAFFLKGVVCLLNMSTCLDAWLAARTHVVARVTASSSKQGRVSKIARKEWNTSCIHKRKATFSTGINRIKTVHQDEVFCCAGYEALEI